MPQVTLDQALQIAVKHHQEGRLSEAEVIYRQIIEAVPGHADALHLLGAVRGQMGEPAVAVEWIQKAIAIDEQPYFYSNLSKFLLDCGKVKEAVAAGRKALEMSPDFADALNNSGNALKANGQAKEAIAQFRRAIALNPQNAEVYSNMGDALRWEGQLEEAETACRRAIGIWPGFAEGHNNLGHVLEARGKHEAAAEACRDAIRLKPALAAAHNNLAIVLVSLEQFEEAETEAREALRLKPGHAEAWNTLGTALNGQMKYDEAIEACRKAMELKSGFVEARNNMGSAMYSSGKLEEAIAEFRSALQSQPDNEQAVNNLGSALNATGKYEEALDVGKMAVSLRPELSEGHFNLGIMLLQRGDLKNGFAEYEWRFRNKDAIVRTFNEPRWDGGPLNGRRILIHAEQGLGDTLHFVRYAPLIKAKGGVVIVECQAALKGLLETVAGIDELVVQGEPLPAFDVQIPMMSLPMALGTTLETVPADVPYIRVDAARVAKWKERLAGVKELKVGLVWAGSKHHKGDKIRSMKLADFTPVAALPGVKLYSLQKGEPAEQVKDAPFEIVDWTDELQDFSDTAGLIENLDLVLTVDTSVCHLAGALGKKVWVMIPAAGEWRWLIGREDNPWYPSLRLFRQKKAKEWGQVVEDVAAALRQARKR